MVEDPFLPVMEEVTEIGDELKEAYPEVDDLKASGNLKRSYPYPTGLYDRQFLDCIDRFVLDNTRRVLLVESECLRLRLVAEKDPAPLIAGRSVANVIEDGRRWYCTLSQMSFSEDAILAFLHSKGQHPLIAVLLSIVLPSLIRDEGQHPLIGGRRVADAIVVSAVILLSFVYLYLIGCIDRGGSRAGSSGSLEFRDIYISILLFRAAYVWIKFRDVIPRGAVYQKPGSHKFEPRIKFPVTRGVGGKSKRVPLGLYDTFVEAEIAYQIAAFYCNKPRHRLGRLDLGGGAYFPIPALSVDPNLPYKEQVNQVRDQVLKVYAEFEQQKASRNLPPCVPGLALEMSTGEGHLFPTSPIQQPINSRVDSAMQGLGSQPAPNIYNGDDFNNPCYLLPVLLKTHHELLEAKKQIECLKTQLSRTEVENNKLKHRNSELECENGLSNQQIMQLQSQQQPLHQEPDFDLDIFLSMEHEESLAMSEGDKVW